MSLVNKKPENLRQRARNALVDPSTDPSIVLNFLNEHFCLRYLKSLDLSGWNDFVSTRILAEFVGSRDLNFLGKKWFRVLIILTSKIRLGLVLCSAAFHPDFSPENCRESFGNLLVAGLANTEQIEVALRHYPNRSNYVQKAMYYLFQDSDFFSIPRPDTFNLIVDRMEAHPGMYDPCIKGK